ncbi:MAG: prepilin-type N-terminal cleavage/methylation domain-containing protein [Clostridia bacterium]|nr:prepilin-type N-terminal cleavage/methylation domain-containing protein [Clostridia bacterium]
MQNNRLNKNNKGVTLIEVIAVVAVLGVVMAAVTGFMITGTKMSAQVSDTATNSMKEQTAVEFINRMILGAKSEVKVVEDGGQVTDGDHTYYLALYCGENVQIANGKDPKTQKPVVVYRYADNSGSNIVREIVICPGEIYFEQVNEKNTVTYYLNDDKHVVHLRVTPESEGT